MVGGTAASHAPGQGTTCPGQGYWLQVRYRQSQHELAHAASSMQAVPSPYTLPVTVRRRKLPGTRRRQNKASVRLSPLPSPHSASQLADGGDDDAVSAYDDDDVDKADARSDGGGEEKAETPSNGLVGPLSPRSPPVVPSSAGLAPGPALSLVSAPRLPTAASSTSLQTRVLGSTAISGVSGDVSSPGAAQSRGGTAASHSRGGATMTASAPALTKSRAVALAPIKRNKHYRGIPDFVKTTGVNVYRPPVTYTLGPNFLLHDHTSLHRLKTRAAMMTRQMNATMNAMARFIQAWYRGERVRKRLRDLHFCASQLSRLYKYVSVNNDLCVRVDGRAFDRECSVLYCEQRVYSSSKRPLAVSSRRPDTSSRAWSANKEAAAILPLEHGHGASQSARPFSGTCQTIQVFEMSVLF